MRNKTTDNLQQVGPVTWPTLFRAWEKREASQAGWIRHYRGRGYASWREWRTTAYADLKPQQRQWTLYRVQQPELVVPGWCGGPFRGWRKHYRGHMITFRTLSQRRLIQNNGKVKSIIRKFPTTTQMLGVIWRGKIVVIEGMHRACAVVLAARQGKKINTSMTIALTPWSGRLPNLSSGQKKVIK